MAFTLEDFHDLVELLEQRPDWRANLRRLILTEELLALPSLVRDLVESQRQAAARLERVEARLEGVESRLQGVESRLERLEGAVETLVQVQQRTEERLARMDTRTARFDGYLLERRFRERVHAYLGRFLRRVHVLSNDELARLVEDALDDGRLTDSERASLFEADIIARGRRPDDGKDVFVVGEVSVGVGVDDVKRASQRASALRKLRLTEPTLPVVGAEWVTPDAEALASTLEVWQVVNGSVTPPPERT